MAKRRAQHKPRPNLKPAGDELWRDWRSYIDRRLRWITALQTIPTEQWIEAVADALARYDLTPDAQGRPSGDLPPIAKASPLVFLNQLGTAVEQQPDGGFETRETLEWKADILRAATLIWAGVIDLDDEQIREVAPIASRFLVGLMLETTDLAAFWNRPGVGMTAAELARRHATGDEIVDAEQLRDWMRKAKKA